MSEIKPNLTGKSYAERSQAVRDIEAECIRAEKGEKCDLNQASAKLSELLKKLNEDSQSIHNGTKISVDVSHAHDLHKKELTSLNARVNALSKEKNVPAWVKPVVYSALTVAGIAATVIGYNILAARGTPTPTPTPTPVPAPAPTPTPVPIHQTTIDQMKRQAKVGNREAMKKLEDYWKKGPIPTSEDEKSSIRKAYKPAFTQIFEAQKPRAKSGKITEMDFLESVWQEGEITDSEEEKFSIRNAYQSAFAQIVEENKQRAKVGNRVAMKFLENIWLMGKITDSEEEKSSIRTACNLAIA